MASHSLELSLERSVPERSVTPEELALADCLGSSEEFMPSFFEEEMSLIGSFSVPKELEHSDTADLVTDTEDATTSRTPALPRTSAEAQVVANTNANSSGTMEAAIPETTSKTPACVPLQAQAESLNQTLNDELRVEATPSETQLPGRKRSDSKCCLLATPMDAFLNTQGTPNVGTTVWRQEVKGTKKRHGKIADKDIQKEAAEIRRKYSEAIQKNFTKLYEDSGQVEPLLMVEEKAGSEWKYHSNSQRYFWPLSEKYCREASDKAIAQAWSHKPYNPTILKPLDQEIAELEGKLTDLRLRRDEEDETFDARANIVQELLNLFKPDPALWTNREGHVVTMLKKALEELLAKKPKQSKRSKKRSRDSAGGTGGSNDENTANKKHEGTPPPDRDHYHHETPFGSGDGGGVSTGGPQARLLAHVESASSSEGEDDDSDSESQTSTDWHEEDTEGNDDEGGSGGCSSSSFLGSSPPSCGTQSDTMRFPIQQPTVADGEDGQKQVETQPLGMTSTSEPDIESLTKDFERLQPKPLASSEATDLIAASMAVEKEPEASMKSPDTIHSAASMQNSLKKSSETPDGCIDSQAHATRDTGGFSTVESRMKIVGIAPRGDADTQLSDLYDSSCAKEAKCLETLETADQHTVPTLQSTTCGSTVVTLDTSDQLYEVSQRRQQYDPVTYKVICLRSAPDAASTANLLYDLTVMARDANNRATIAAAGGIACILHAMRMNQNSVAIQKNGCWVLLNLAANNSDNQVSIVEVGGHHCILSAMRQHLIDGHIQEKGCAALKNLTCNFDNQVSVATAGGIDCVLNAMRQHTMNASVQEQGCGALRNLSCQGENKNKIAEAGGIQCILNAMQQHSSNASVQERGCGAIMSLASNNSDNQNSVAAAGGIRFILIAMRQYPTNAAVQDKGCGALMNMTCSNSSNQGSVAAAGGIQRILDAMKMHSNNASIQEKGCKTLCNVSFAANTRSILKANGARQVVRTAKQNFPEDKKVQVASSNALKKLPRW